MFEPITAITSALAIANFIVSTIDKLHEKGRIVKYWRYKLLEYHCRLSNAQQNYLNWEDKWKVGEDALGEDELESVLGSKHYQDRANNLEWLHHSVERVEAVLLRGVDPKATLDSESEQQSPRRPGRNAPSVGDWEAWHTAVKSTNLISPTIAKRIVGALWDNEHLKQSLIELEMSMNTLESLSNGALEGLRELGLPDGETPGEQVRRVWTLRAHRSEFAAFVTRLHRESDWVSKGYGIVLHEPRGPESEDLRGLKHERPLTIDVLVANPPSSDAPVSQKVRIPFSAGRLLPPEKQTSVVRILNGDLGGLPGRHQTRAPWHWRSVQDLRAHARNHGGKEPSLLRTERAQNAVRLTYWVLLLWETPWATNICPCRVDRYENTAEVPPIVLTKSANHNSSDVLFETHSDLDAWCENHILTSSDYEAAPEAQYLAALRAEEISGLCEAQRRLLHFTLTLCEVALGKPVQLVLIRDDGIWFDVQGVRMDEGELLAEVSWYTSEYTRAAIAWCFARLKSTAGQSFRQEDVLLFSSKVLKRLQECHKDAEREIPDTPPANIAMEYLTAPYILSPQSEHPGELMGEEAGLPQASTGAERHNVYRSMQIDSADQRVADMQRSTPGVLNRRLPIRGENNLHEKYISHGHKRWIEPHAGPGK